MKIGKHKFTEVPQSRIVSFGEWMHQRELNEVGTGTGDVAAFVRPIFSEPCRRPGLPYINSDGEVENFYCRSRKRK